LTTAATITEKTGCRIGGGFGNALEFAPGIFTRTKKRRTEVRRDSDRKSKIENPKSKIHSGDSAVAKVIVEIEQIGE
jgi:hypothetical protein